MVADIAYSDEVLEKIPERGAKLLSAIGAVPAIRTALAGAGMIDDDIIEGRTLLLACLAAPRSAEVAADTAEAKAQREALAAIDEWDEPSFGRFQATLKRHFPAQEAYVFVGLSASTGSAAVAGVAAFLSRVDALELGTDSARKATSKEDKSAVDLLAKRGLTKAERQRLRGLIDVALGPTTPLGQAPSTEADDRRHEALAKLKSWFDEWAGHAHAVVKKRASLIRLGLASRRAPKAKAAAEEKWVARTGRMGARSGRGAASSGRLPARSRRLPSRCGGFRPGREASVSREKGALVEGVGLGRAAGCPAQAEKGSFLRTEGPGRGRKVRRGVARSVSGRPPTEQLQRRQESSRKILLQASIANGRVAASIAYSQVGMVLANIWQGCQ